MADLTTRVLVVGGGPVGLTASALLSQQGIPHVLVERREHTLRAPAAHVLRPRTMETFDRIGVGDAVREATPMKHLDSIVWCATLAGAEVGRLAFEGDGLSGLGWTNCPQNLLEPILLRRAQQEDVATILRGAEWTDLTQDDRGVRATVRCADGNVRTVEAAWAIACDGAGSPVRRHLGIPMVGPGPQGRFFMVHFEADVRPHMAGRASPLFWIMNPQASGTVIVHDPAGSLVFMTMRFGSDGEEETIPARLDAALGAELSPTILSMDAWSPHVQTAERYREGRVFLAGDAAHRFPPSGGLGLNTGILDADFLVHGLAEVEHGRAPFETLDRYERDCRPVAVANAEASFANLKRMAEIPQALGPCADLPALEARLTSLSPEERKRLDQAIEHQRSHFTSHGKLPPDPRA